MQYALLSLLCIVVVIGYVQRSAISVPAGLIEQELHLDSQTMGLVMGAWYWGYAAFQVPGGWLADRWGSRRALFLFAALWSALTGAAALAQGLAGLLVAWTAMGCLQAGLFPCATKAVGDWFDDRRRALASGLLGSSTAVGIALAPMLTSHLLVHFSWRYVFVLYMLPGILWAILFIAIIPAASRPLAAASRRLPAAFAWRRLLTSLPMGLLCLQQFLRAAAMVFFSTWFPRFLQETRGVSQFEAGQLTALPGLGVILGAMSGGYVSDWILKRTGNRRLSRQGIAVVGMLCCAALFLAANFAPQTGWAIGLMSCGTFWAAFGGVSGYSVAIDFGGTRVATVFSIMNMCGSIGAGLFPILLVWLVEKYHAWELALPLLAGIFLADALCWMLLNPRGTLFEESVA